MNYFHTLLLLSFFSLTSLSAQKKAYVCTYSDIYLVDFETCSTQHIGNSNNYSNTPIEWYDIAMNPQNKELYGVTFAGVLYKIDRTNSAPHLIAPILGIGDINSLTFGKDGTLYGARFSGELITIDTSTGIWANIGNFVPYSPQGDIAFHNNTLHYLAKVSNPNRTYLLKVDLNNANQHWIVGEFPGSTMYGLTSVGCNMKLYASNADDILSVSLSGAFQYDTVCTSILNGLENITGIAGIDEDIGIPHLDLGPDKTLCLGDTVLLNVAGSTGQYLWHNGDTIPYFTVTQTGDYSVTIQNDSCSVSDTINVAYETPPVLNLTDTTLCEGQTLILDLSHFNLNYIWSDQTTNPIFQVSVEGTYGVTVTGGACDVFETDSMHVDYEPYPNISLDSVYNLCIDENLTLHAYIDGANYLWQDHSTADSFLVTQAGSYAVEVTNYCGSSYKAIEVIENCNCIRAIPNAFSPNDDGKNDYFRPLLQCPLQKARLRVFNRWGQTVCDTQDIFTGWDGRLNNVACPQETYIYLFEFEESDGSPQAIRGELRLIL